MSRHLVMEGSFEDFTLQEVLEVTSLSRQFMKIVLDLGGERSGEILIKSGQIIEARDDKGADGFEGLRSLFEAPLVLFQVFRMKTPEALKDAMGPVADMLKRLTQAKPAPKTPEPPKASEPPKAPAAPSKPQRTLVESQKSKPVLSRRRGSGVGLKSVRESLSGLSSRSTSKGQPVISRPSASADKAAEAPRTPAPPVASPPAASSSGPDPTMLFDVDWGDNKDQNVKALHDRLNQLDELSQQLDAMRKELRELSSAEAQAERWKALDARLAEMSGAMLTADALEAWTPASAPMTQSDALTAEELQSALAGLEQAIANRSSGGAPDEALRASVQEGFRSLQARLDAVASSNAAQPSAASANQSAMDEALVKMVLAVNDRLGRPAVSPLILGLAMLQVLSLLLLVGLAVKVMGG